MTIDLDDEGAVLDFDRRAPPNHLCFPGGYLAVRAGDRCIRVLGPGGPNGNPYSNSGARDGVRVRRPKTATWMMSNHVGLLCRSGQRGFGQSLVWFGDE